MSEYNKQRYYWIKLTDRFMTSDTVDFLMGQKDGANYVVLYQMLCLKTVNNNGELSRTIGEVIIPYDEEKIQRDMKYFSIDTIRVAMDLYRRLGLIYEQENGILKIANFDNMVGSQTISAYKKQIQLSNKGGKKVEFFPPYKDIDIDIDKDIEYKEKSVEKKATTPYYCITTLEQFVDTYNISIDNYSAMITELDFTALAKAYSESKWLQTNIISLSKICREYKRIIGGYYKDYEKPKTSKPEDDCPYDFSSLE